MVGAPALPPARDPGSRRRSRPAIAAPRRRVAA